MISGRMTVWLLAMAVSLSSVSVKAADISGTITTTTWTKAQSPYHITAAATVPSGNVLTVEAGVEVLFDSPVPLTVEGRIRVLGMMADRVVFRPGTASSWGGIRIGGGDTSTIQYADLSFAWVYGSGGAVYVTGTGTRLGLIESGLSYNEVIADGGGLTADDQASVTVLGCNISDNTAAYGGGISVVNGGSLHMGNSVVSYNGADQDGGGLFLVNGAQATLVSSVITNNGTYNYYGGGIEAWDNVELTMIDCAVTENIAGDDGGGLDLSSNTIAILTRCRIDWNDGYYGGGIWTDSLVTMTDCLVADNLALAEGGGMAVFNGPVTLTNCTFAENISGTSVSDVAHSGGVYVYADLASQLTTTLLNTIVWANVSGGIYIDPAQPGIVNAMYSDIQSTAGVWTGTGNINADPLFANGEADSYYLNSGSPCIDAGNPSSPRDADNSLADMGAVAALSPVSVEQEQARPAAMVLEQNIPNPFNPSTTIPFALSATGHIQLTVYNAAGQLVAVVADGVFQFGRHTVTWDGRDAFGRPAGNGIYIYRLRTPTGITARRMTLMR